MSSQWAIAELCRNRVRLLRVAEEEAAAAGRVEASLKHGSVVSALVLGVVTPGLAWPGLQVLRTMYAAGVRCTLRLDCRSDAVCLLVARTRRLTRLRIIEPRLRAIFKRRSTVLCCEKKLGLRGALPEVLVQRVFDVIEAGQ